MAPEEICRRLGEGKIKTLFLSLTSDGMKKLLQESDLPTKRGANQISTAQRNAAYAERFWRHVAAGKGNSRACATLLYEFLIRQQRAMLAAFLGAADVANEDGLTDANFMQETPPEKLQAAARTLLATTGPWSRQDVAAYLLFLEATSDKPVFDSLALEAELTPAGPEALRAP